MEVSIAKIHQYMNLASQVPVKQTFGIQLALDNDTPGLDGFSPFQRYSWRTPMFRGYQSPVTYPLRLKSVHLVDLLTEMQSCEGQHGWPGSMGSLQLW